MLQTFSKNPKPPTKLILMLMTILLLTPSIICVQFLQDTGQNTHRLSRNLFKNNIVLSQPKSFKNPLTGRQVFTDYIDLANSTKDKIFYSLWKNTKNIENAPIVISNPGNY